MVKVKDKKELRVYSGEEIVQMRDQLQNDRDMFISLRETCRFFFKPQDRFSYNFGTNVAGKQTPVNPTGIRAHSTFTSGLFSNTINLSDEFFGYVVADKDLNESDNVKDYFSKCSDIAINKLGSSNYSLSTFETISDYACVCTGVQYSEMSKDKGLRFKNFLIDHCGIAEDSDGRVETVLRDFQLTSAQAIELFGYDNVPEQVRRNFEVVKTRFKKEDYIHAVFPRDGYRKDEEDEYDSKTFKYASYYVYVADTKKVEREQDMGLDTVIEEAGYHTFPYAVPRLEKNYDNPYGRGVPFNAKGHMSALDTLTAIIDDAIELKANPCVFLPVGNSDQSDIQLTPASVNFYNPAFGLPIFYQPDIDVGNATVRQQEMEKKIMELFYADLFLMLEDRKNMTATEVHERMSEKSQAILPIIARLYDELYSVTLKRVFYLLLNNGFFPEMPEELAEVWGNQELRIDYTTKLDMKLKQLELAQVVKGLNESAILLQMQAEMPDIESVLHVEKLLKDIFRHNAVSPDYIKDDEETAEWKEAKAQMQQQQQAMEQQQAMMKPIDTQASIAPNSIMAEQQASLASTGNMGLP